MKAGIITISYNSVHILREFLNGLQQSEWFHIVVDGATEPINWCPTVIVDNGSEDYVVEYLKVCEGREEVNYFIYNENNYMFTHALNQGIKLMLEKHPDIDYFVSINPDVMPNRGWLSSIIGHMEESPNIGISGCILMQDDKTIQHAGAYGGGEHTGEGEELNDQLLQVRTVPWVTGACMVIKREVIDKIGLFNEERYVHFGSDREFCERAKSAGFDTICSPVVLRHYYGYSSMISASRIDIAMAEESGEIALMCKNKDGMYKQALSQSTVNMKDTTEVSAPDFIKERIEKYGFGN